jgi:uncharacterized protein (DUF2141 family)
MRQNVSILSVLVGVFFWVSCEAGQESRKTDTLVLHVTNLVTPPVGAIDVTVYKNDSTFLSDTSWFLNKAVTCDSTMTKCTCDMTMVLPHDEYALIVFQDLNLNRNLDVNFFGYPKEPFAFSRHFRPILRAPKFSEISFHCRFSRDTLVIPLMR